MKNIEFFYLLLSDDQDAGVAYAQGKIWHADLAKVYMDGVVPRFELKNGPPRDYLSNDLGWPMCSSRMKTLLDLPYGYLTAGWISAEVIDSGGRAIGYYIPVFSDPPNVLNTRKTLVSEDGLVIKPYLDREKVNSLEFFPVPGSTARLIVSGRIKDTLAGCTGIDFGSVPIS
jgi:hypothetical protein